MLRRKKVDNETVLLRISRNEKEGREREITQGMWEYENMAEELRK